MFTTANRQLGLTCKKKALKCKFTFCRATTTMRSVIENLNEHWGNRVVFILYFSDDRTEVGHMAFTFLETASHLYLTPLS